VLASDDHHPGHFGFDSWLSVTNFFDRDPVLSRQGTFEEFEGDSSEIAVAEAVQFIDSAVAAQVPSFTVIWFGTPHSPFRAADADMAAFAHLDESSRHHYGELVALDRSLGTLRGALQKMQIESNTLLWYCSDNGGLPKITPETVGGLRGFKGSLYEGGLRVPGIIQWTGTIQPRISHFPASVLDIVPTVAEIVGLPADNFVQPQDGISLLALFEGELSTRLSPIPFNYGGQTALVDNDWKIIRIKEKKQSISAPQFEIYDLARDPTEAHNVVDKENATTQRLKQQLLAWEESLALSIAGKDYPEQVVDPREPSPRAWVDVAEYQPYLESWKSRPEYRDTIQRAAN
jgi:arylsulfatase A-like enzyme